MKDFDKIFQENFRGEKEGLSPKNENALWEAITDDLGVEGSIPSKKIGFGSKFLLIGSFLGVVAIISTFILFSSKNKSNDIILPSDNSSSSQDLIYSNETAKDFTTDQPLNQISMSKESNSKDKEPKAVSITSKNHPINVNETKNQHLESTSLRSDKISINPINKDIQSFNSTFEQDNASNSSEILESNESSKAYDRIPRSVGNYPIPNTISTQEKNLTSAETAINATIQKSNNDNVSKDNVIDKITTNNNASFNEQFTDFTGVTEKSQGVQSTEYQQYNTVSSSYIVVLLQAIEYDENAREVLRSMSSRLELQPVFAPETAKDNNVEFSINVMGGLNRSTVSYSGTNTSIVQDENAFTNGYYGYNIGSEIQLNYKKNWTLLTGLHLENQKTKFDKTYTKTLKPDEPILNGIVVDIANNQVSREMFTDTSFVYQSLNRSRQIRNINSLRIPLMVGYESNRFGWNVGIQGGTMLHVNVNNPSDTNKAYSAIKLGFNISPYVRYEFNPRLSLIARYGISRYQQSVTELIGLDETRYLHSLNIGVRYGL